MSSTNTLTTTANVTHQFEGLSYSVPEWRGYTHVGKPALITSVRISHRVTKGGVADVEVHVEAYALKKDGTPMAQRMDTRFSLSSYGPQSGLRDELAKEFGAEAKAEAQAVWQKLYG